MTTSFSVSGASWSGTAPILLAASSSFPPSLGGGYNHNNSTPLRASSVTASGDVEVFSGTHGASIFSWDLRPQPSPIDAYKWTSIAHSTFGETLVVWPTGCTVDVNACNVAWAWTDNDGSTWSTGTLTSADTPGKVYVEYDRFRDRFVMAYIDAADSRIVLRSALAAAAPSWSTESLTFAVPYRHLGGMVFDNSGNALLVASSGYGPNKGRIVQFDIGGSGATYSLSNPNYITFTGTLAVTRRPFGIAYDAGPDNVMIVWRNTGSTRSMGVCTHSGLSASTPCSAPTFPISDIVNGVDLAYDPPNNRFVAGFSY